MVSWWCVEVVDFWWWGGVIGRRAVQFRGGLERVRYVV